MTDFDAEKLVVAAREVSRCFACSEDCVAGGVGAAVLADSGAVFTGICIEATCGIGFCAEHAAIAEMLKAGRTRIVAIVAVCEDGRVLPPCGRCRELIRQVDSANWNTRVVLPDNIIATLGDLLPYAQRAAPADT
jgi:cytidine deaminase